MGYILRIFNIWNDVLWKNSNRIVVECKKNNFLIIFFIKITVFLIISILK